MDKEFEEWKTEQKLNYFTHSLDEIAEQAWNASKQYWLDKAVEVVAERKSIFGIGISALDKAAYSALDGAAEAIKELKE